MSPKTQTNPPRTEGEIEAAICQAFQRFQVEYMGRGPRQISAHLIDDLLLIRLEGVLTAAEQHLVTSLPQDRGRDLLKEVRTKLIESARDALEQVIVEATGVHALSLHHDISTTSGEEIVVFTLTESPSIRKKR